MEDKIYMENLSFVRIIAPSSFKNEFGWNLLDDTLCSKDFVWEAGMRSVQFCLLFL